MGKGSLQPRRSGMFFFLEARRGSGVSESYNLKEGSNIS